MKAKKSEQVLTAQSAAFQTNRVDLEDHSRVSVQITITNGAAFTGTATLQLSNDYDNWVSVTDTATNLSGATGDHFIEIETAAAYARVSVTIGTGSADFEFDWMAK